MRYCKRRLLELQEQLPTETDATALLKADIRIRGADRA